MWIRAAWLLLILAGGLPGAVVIDRMAVVVGKRVIKASDIDTELRLTEFLNGDEHFSADAKRKAAERLIDQAVIRTEMESGNYKPAALSDAEALLEQLKRNRFGGSDTRLQEALSRYQISEDQLQSHLLWQVTVLRFIDQRFRPGVLVTEDELGSYYGQHLAELKREFPQDYGFEALSPKIRESLEGERINQNFVEWVEQARKRAQVEYRQGAFQ